MLNCPWARSQRKLALSHSSVPPPHTGPAADTNCGSLHSSKQVIQSQSQTLILTCTGFPTKIPISEHTVVSFRPNQSIVELAPQEAHPKRDLCKHQTLMGGILLQEVRPKTADHTLWVGSILTVSEHETQLHSNREVNGSQCTIKQWESAGIPST